MKNSTQKVLLSEAQIARRVEELAGEISAEYRGKNSVGLCAEGSGGLCQRSDAPSKGGGGDRFYGCLQLRLETASSGAVRILKDLDSSIREGLSSLSRTLSIRG